MPLRAAQAEDEAQGGCQRQGSLRETCQPGARVFPRYGQAGEGLGCEPCCVSVGF